MDGWKIAVEANGGKPVAMEEAKSLEAGCSTALVAALDPSLKCELKWPDPTTEEETLTPQSTIGRFPSRLQRRQGTIEVACR